MSKNILFIFNFGSELRQFIHSGLIDKLLLEGKNVFISSKHTEKEFIDCLPTNVKLLPYYRDEKSHFFNIINIALNATTSSQLKFDPFKLNYTSILSYLLNLNILILVFLSKYRLIRNLLVLLENFAALKIYSRNWELLLLANNIDLLVTSVPNTNISLLSSASKLNINRVLIFHTNKDLYTIDRFIISYNKYGVWNLSMKERIHSDFNIPDNCIEIIGCLHFFYLMEDYINNYSGLKANDKKFMKNKSSQFVYICGALNYNDEDVLVASLIAVCDKIFKNNYKIILRINPMETRDIWEKFKSPKVDLLFPEWHYNKKTNFNYAFLNDLRRFSSILSDSKAIFGLPSTFFIESSLFNLPFFLLMIDSRINNTTSNSDIFSFWQHKIFDFARCSKTVIPIDSPVELNDTILNLDSIINSINTSDYKDYLEKEITYMTYGETISSHLKLLL